MIISYVGNRLNLDTDGKSFNTENHIALTLERLGHTVRFIQESEIPPGSLPGTAAGSDLFLWTRTWPGKVTLEDLAKIEAAGIPTASFHLDKYAGIKRDGGLASDVFWRTQYVFSPEGSRQSATVFAQHGINQRYLAAGVFEDECYIAEPVERFKHDLVFIGGGVTYAHPEWNDYRRQLVTFLATTYGSRYRKFGHPEPTIRGRELNELCSSAKIVVGDSLCKDFMDSWYFSDRIFEQTGRGAFTIAPYIPGITDYFRDREEVVLYAYGNWTQLKNLIDYYLAHDEEREAIRRAGHERTKRDHTYRSRLTQMLDVLRSEGALQ
jgi:hypothetical protein